MASVASRKQRGRQTEIALAYHLRNNGFPYAEPVGSGTPGRDITGTPGVQIEVKARRGLVLQAWLKQAAGHGDDLPVLVVRPDGLGKVSIGSWAAVLTVDDLLTLLKGAGYGQELTERMVDDITPRKEESDDEHR